MIDIRKIAKRGTFASNQDCVKCKYGSIERGHKFCDIIEDFVDGYEGYICPKFNDNLRYCEKYDTYCHKEYTCNLCPYE